MSELLGDARILIRPDTTRFRAELIAQVTAASKNVVVPVAITAATSTAAATTAASQFAGATTAVSAAVTQETVALQKQGVALAQSTAKTQAATAAQGQFQKGLVASAAGLTGLRGAVLSASSPFLIAAVGATAFGAAVKSAANLEADLNVFRVVAGATADEMERVGDEAKALGRDLTLPGVTAGDAAQTFLALSRAGLSVENSLDGARGVLQLAVAAQIDFADAAQLTASALNAFGLQGEQAVEVADLLTNAANESQASISDMGIALRQSAAIADLAGFSLSETATFLTELAQAGLAGSDAGTSFRVAIQRLIAPTGAAKDALEGLNLNLRDAQGNLRPEVFFELGDALDRMGRAQADATRQLIFGNDASRAAAFFARITTKEFRNQEEALKESGSAAKVAGARNAGFAGSVENLKNQITALGIEIGELALPGLGLAADGAALFFGALATQIGESRDAIAGFADDAEQLQEFLTIINDDSGFTDFLKDAGRQAQTFGDIVDDITGANDFVDFFQRLGGETQKAAPAVKRLATEEQQLGRDVNLASDAVDEQSRSLEALTAQVARAASAVARLQGQQKGLEEQTTRARISGDEDAELASLKERRANLEAELAKQEDIIARPGTAGDATAREAIRQRILPQLEAVNSEIENILQEQQTKAENIQRDRENAQRDQIRARNEADRNFLDLLGNRRDDASRRVSAAAETASVADDIRTQNNLQALIKQQIAKIRDRIKDEQTRKAAIRELRIALIASRAEEKKLRQEQIESAREQRITGTELDIELADINDNEARQVALRRRLIAQLRKKAKDLHLTGNALKENRNAIARINQEIADIQKEQEKTGGGASGQSAQQFFFEQLQAQQGFASNLLGNLIPRDQTAGLVGNPSPSPGGGISIAASVQEGKSTAGVTSGQVSTTNELLRNILQQLKHLNGADAAPEAKYQRGQGASIMDGGGGNIVAM